MPILTLLAKINMMTSNTKIQGIYGKLLLCGLALCEESCRTVSGQECSELNKQQCVESSECESMLGAEILTSSSTPNSGYICSDKWIFISCVSSNDCEEIFSIREKIDGTCWMLKPDCEFNDENWRRN